MPLPHDDIERARAERGRRRAAKRRQTLRRRRLAAAALLGLLALAAGALALLLSSGGSDRPASATAARKQPGRAEPGAARSSQPEARRVAALKLPANPAPRSVHLPILNYHRVNPLRPGAGAVETDLTIAPRDFAAQMKAIHAAGYNTVTQRQLYDALFKGVKLPSKPVLLSFDDGYVDAVKHILPVLRRYRMTGSFYVITSRFHEPGFLTEAQLRKLDLAGMDIGSHTVDHTDLTALSPAGAAAQLRRSKAKLEHVLGHPVDFLCYPSGRFDAGVVEQARKAGYVTAVTTQGGATASARESLAIPRFHVGRGATPQSVLGLVGS